MDQNEVKIFIEAALLAAGRPLNIDQLQNLFDGRMAPEKAEIRAAIVALNEDYSARGILVSEVASGFRMQVKSTMADRLQKLWEERPPRYSRAMFETLALIAYRQPITRGEIEEIRGVAVSSNITRQLLEREWVRVVGHRDVPGRPAMFGTTKAFLDYFSLKKLDDLPPLADLSDWETLRIQLNLPDVEGQVVTESSDEVPTEELAEGDDLDLPIIEDAVELASGANDEVALDSLDDGNKNVPQLQPEADAESSLSEVSENDEDEELVVSEWPAPVA